MGRQIQFFMVDKDETEFVNKVIVSGDIFIDDKGKKVLAEDVPKHMVVWIVSPKSKIVINRVGNIDDDRVDGIQFVRNMIWENKYIQSGRLWVQLNYYSSYDEDAQIINKDKWLADRYNYYKRWIVKNSTISKDKMFYVGKATRLLYKQEGYKLKQGPKTEINFG